MIPVACIDLVNIEDAFFLVNVCLLLRGGGGTEDPKQALH